MSTSSSSSAPHGADLSSRTVNAIPKAALRALEPRPGGHWIVESQSNGAFNFVYVMDEVEETVSYALRPCTTEEEIREHCKDFCYDMPPPSPQRGNSHGLPGNNNQAETFLPTTFAPQQHPAQVHGQFGHGSSTAGPSSYAVSQNIGLEHAMGGTSSSMPISSRSGQTFGQPMEHFNSQQPVRNEQNGIQRSPLSAAPSSSTENDWPMNNSFLPPMGQNTENTIAFTSSPDTSYGTTSMDNNWNQFYSNGYNAQ